MTGNIIKYKYFFLLIILITAVSCNDTILNESNIEDSKEVIFILNHASSDSRAIYNEDGSGNFVEGDCVDLSHSDKKFVLTFSNGEWTPRITIGELGHLWGEYYAYYPSIEDSYNDIRQHKIIQDQRDIDNYSKSDLLQSYTYKSSEDASPNIEMNFKHAMHRLSINISAKEGNIPEDLEINVKSVISTITVDASTNNVSYHGNIEYGEITPFKAGLGKYKAILAPSHNMDDIKDKWITIRTEGKETHYPLPSSYSILETGKETTINLTISSQAETEEDLRGKIKWIGNLAEKNPLYDENNIISYTSNEIYNLRYQGGVWFDNKDKDLYYRQYLGWSENCGWYDCNKDMSDDTSMCWAAATSNMLHSWIENNKEYIRRYYEINPDAQPCPSYDFTPGKISDIWHMYKDAFQDRAGNIADGIEWFFSGNRGANIPDYSSELINYKGVFKEVFNGTPPNLRYYRGGIPKDKFNQYIKDAIRNGDLIGFAANEYSTIVGEKPLGKPALHSMTIWGVEFDENEDVSAIYYVDNNTSASYDDNMFRQGLLIRALIKYDQYGNVFRKYNDYNNKYQFQVISIETLGLGKKEWENYFNNIQTNTDK